MKNSIHTFQFALLLIFSFAIGSTGFAQQNASHTDYGHHSYQKAIRKYEAQVKKHPNDGEILFNLANSYRLNGQTVKAESWFARAVAHSDRAEAQLFYAQMLLSNGNYGPAKAWFEKYATIAPNETDAANARALALQAQRLANDGIQMEKYSILHLPFNSEQLDFSPVLWKPGTLVFASNRDGSRGKKSEKDPWTEENFVDLYAVSKIASGGYSAPVQLNRKLNSRYHEGPAAFNSAGDVMYFTRSDYVKRKRGFDDTRNTQLKIYRAEWVEDEWIIGNALSFNDRQFSSCHPALSQDGNVMIFASDRPGGFGGMDLYRVKRQGDAWGAPQNLGPTINTAGNEVFPFLHPSGVLYFSSDLQVGIGGLDIFHSKQGENGWERPQNIGAPINSPRDDFGLIMAADQQSGYFTSNRNGKDDDIYSFISFEGEKIRARVVDCETQTPIPGVTVMKTGSAEDMYVSDENGWVEFEAARGDLYHLQASGEDYFFREGCEGATDLSVPHEGLILLPVARNCPSGDCPQLPAQPILMMGTVTDALTEAPLPGAKIELVDKCTGKSRIIAADENGNYQFLMPKKPKCDYWLIAKKPGYTPRNIPLSTKGRTLDSPETLDVPLDPSGTPAPADQLPVVLGTEPGTPATTPNGDPRNVTVASGAVIELYNIYFNYDKDFIRGDAISDLEYVLELMRKYPNMKGEIAAHTDSRATDAYNIDLSNRRAQSAKEWLLRRGVAPERITARGYGETQLLNECSDGVECDEKQHQRNRRVEFRITYFDGVVNSKEYDYFRKDGSRP